MSATGSLTLGLDIGGANLKAATARGEALTVPFPLWQAPHELTGRLRDLLGRFPHDRLAVTMTAELCDCFPTKRAGVDAILNSLSAAAPETPVGVWSTAGCFVTGEQARADPWRVASANWHALATYAGRFVPQGRALLIDVGSTTTDIVRLCDGQPTPLALIDPERLATGELVYTGVRRTPLCAVLGRDAAAEFFATMQDVYLILGMIPEEADRCDTADGRPATCAHAHARLARMRCSDTEAFSREDAVALAQHAHRLQFDHLVDTLRSVAKSLPARPTSIILSGSGEFLARIVVARAGLGNVHVITLADRLSAPVSAAACAYALAVLAEETGLGFHR